MCIWITTLSDIKVACLYLKNAAKKICSLLGTLMVVTHGIRDDRISIRAETEVKVSPRFHREKALSGQMLADRVRLITTGSLKAMIHANVNQTVKYFQCTGPQFGRVKSRRITVGKSLTIFTSILSRRGKPVKSFESWQIYAQIGCAFHINKRWICTFTFIP